MVSSKVNTTDNYTIYHPFKVRKPIFHMTSLCLLVTFEGP